MCDTKHTSKGTHGVSKKIIEMDWTAVWGLWVMRGVNHRHVHEWTMGYNNYGKVTATTIHRMCRVHT